MPEKRSKGVKKNKCNSKVRYQNEIKIKMENKKKNDDRAKSSFLIHERTAKYSAKFSPYSCKDLKGTLGSLSPITGNCASIFHKLIMPFLSSWLLLLEKCSRTSQPETFELTAYIYSWLVYTHYFLCPHGTICDKWRSPLCFTSFVLIDSYCSL